LGGGGSWAVKQYCGHEKRVVCKQIENRGEVGGGILMGSGLILTNLCSSTHQITSSTWSPSYNIGLRYACTYNIVRKISGGGGVGGSNCVV
jgi:hypothetical protein